MSDNEGPATLPDVIYAQVSPTSVGGRSLFDPDAVIHAGNVTDFFSDGDVIARAVQRLEEQGFDVLQVTHTTINIAGSAEVYEKAFGTPLVAEKRTVLSGDGTEVSRTFVDAATPSAQPGLLDTAASPLADIIEGVAIEQPVTYFESAFAPPSKYWHLDVPGDVSLALNADRAHRSGVTGRGIRVVMVDTGWYRHPFFTERGYRSAPVVLAPGAANANADEHGHGTGESANIFAAAPDVEFTMVKQGNANATAAFNAAVALTPHIISCSWGFDIQNGPLAAAQQALAAAVATAVASGIVVVFSAGNGHFGFPGQHPDVISAGGVFMAQDGSMTASDYASGFASSIYPGRNVPDVSGLVGMLPKAIYIMFPQQPADVIDNDNAGGTHPNGDETAANDGWAAFSGTSAAAPQLAGVCALLKEACTRLTPADVKDILKKTARDVTTGTCNPRPGMNHSATVGADLATGNGLVDAHKAVLMAKVRCLGPIKPIGITPIGVLPVAPITPIKPIKPIIPVVPIQPIAPIKPIKPIQPIEPIQPVPIKPIGPIGPGPLEAPAETAEPAGKELTGEDIAALEDLIVKGDSGIED